MIVFAELIAVPLNLPTSSFCILHTLHQSFISNFYSFVIYDILRWDVIQFSDRDDRLCKYISNEISSIFTNSRSTYLLKLKTETEN